MKSYLELRAQLTELNDKAREFEARRELQAARDAYVEALKFAEEQMGKFDPNTIEVLCRLGTVALRLHEVNAAQELFLDARDRITKALYPNHTIYLDVYSGLGDRYFETEQFADAVYFYTESMKIVEERGLTDLDSYPRMLGRIGDCYRALGKFGEAGHTYGKLLLHYEKTTFQDLDKSKKLLARLATTDFEEFRDDRGNVSLLEEADGFLEVGGCLDFHLRADLWLELGMMKLLEAQEEEADRLIRLAYQTHVEHHGESHSAVIPALQSLLSLAKARSDGETVKLLYTHLLTMVEQKFGKESKELALLSEQAAEALAAFGYHEQSQEMYKQSLAALDSPEGEESPRLAQTLHNLGILALNEKKFQEAGDYLARALAINKKIYGPQNSHVAISLAALGAMHELKGETHQALQYFSAVTQMRGTALSDDDPILQKAFDFLVNTAGINREPAKPVSNEALQQVPQLFSQATDKIAEKDFKSAAELFEKLLSLLENAYGLMNANLVQPLEQLAFAREQLGEKEKAAELRKRIKAIKR